KNAGIDVSDQFVGDDKEKVRADTQANFGKSAREEISAGTDGEKNDHRWAQGEGIGGNIENVVRSTSAPTERTSVAPAAMDPEANATTANSIIEASKGLNVDAPNLNISDLSRTGPMVQARVQDNANEQIKS